MFPHIFSLINCSTTMLVEVILWWRNWLQLLSLAPSLFPCWLDCKQRIFPRLLGCIPYPFWQQSGILLSCLGGHSGIKRPFPSKSETTSHPVKTWRNKSASACLGLEQRWRVPISASYAKEWRKTFKYEILHGHLKKIGLRWHSGSSHVRPIIHCF